MCIQYLFLYLIFLFLYHIATVILRNSVCVYIYRSKTHACTRAHEHRTVWPITLAQKPHTNESTDTHDSCSRFGRRVVFTFNWIDASAKRFMNETKNAMRLKSDNIVITYFFFVKINLLAPYTVIAYQITRLSRMSLLISISNSPVSYHYFGTKKKWLVSKFVDVCTQASIIDSSPIPNWIVFPIFSHYDFVRTARHTKCIWIPCFFIFFIDNSNDEEKNGCLQFWFYLSHFVGTYLRSQFWRLVQSESELTGEKK